LPPPAPLVDLVVRKTATPSTTVVGNQITFRITVTNASTAAAADVNAVRVSERSYRLRLLSVTPSQGSCAQGSCNLGRLAPGASATVTAVTQAVAVGRVANVVRVFSEEQESDDLNNVAAALVRITRRPTAGAVKAAVANGACNTLTASPRLLLAGRTSLVLTAARSNVGRPLPGVRVLMDGDGIRQQALTNRRGIARFAVTPRSLGIVHFRRARVPVSAGTRCRTLLAVLSAPRPSVTG
jgi:hypothetical protein